MLPVPLGDAKQVTPTTGYFISNLRYEQLNIFFFHIICDRITKKLKPRK